MTNLNRQRAPDFNMIDITEDDIDIETMISEMKNKDIHRIVKGTLSKRTLQQL